MSQFSQMILYTFFSNESHDWSDWLWEKQIQNGILLFSYAVCLSKNIDYNNDRNAQKVDPFFTFHKMGNLELATSKAMTRLDIPDEAMKRYCKRCHCTRRDIDTHMADVHELSLLIIILVMCFKFLIAFMGQSGLLSLVFSHLIYHLSNKVPFDVYISKYICTYRWHL